MVGPKDSISLISGKGSHKSTTSSARLRAESEKAALEARADTMKEKHALEIEEAKIKARKAQLDLEADIAASTAKLKVIKEYERLSQGSGSKLPQDGMDAYLQGAHS